MEQSELKEPLVIAATNGGAAATASYVYAIGRIEARFPRPSVEKEFAQATGRAETAGLTDRQAVQKVLSARQNRYLARQVCWVITIEGLETYILTPATRRTSIRWWKPCVPRPAPSTSIALSGFEGPSPRQNSATG